MSISTFVEYFPLARVAYAGHLHFRHAVSCFMLTSTLLGNFCQYICKTHNCLDCLELDTIVNICTRSKDRFIIDLVSYTSSSINNGIVGFKYDKSNVIYEI